MEPVVGMGALVLLVTIGVLVSLLKRHRANRNSRLGQQEEHAGFVYKPELHGDPLNKSDIAPEVIGKPVFELPDTSAPVELGHSELEHGRTEVVANM